LITEKLTCVLSSLRTPVQPGPGTMYLFYPPLVAPGVEYMSSNCELWVFATFSL